MSKDWIAWHQQYDEPGAGRSALALLVESDPRLAGRARDAAERSGLVGVEVRTADAGGTDAYVDFAPAHILLACGVFGNITLDDAQRTITAFDALIVCGGVVIWTRGRNDDGDPSDHIRALLGAGGLVQDSFTAPPDARFRVWVHRLDTASGAALQRGQRLFTIV